MNTQTPRDREFTEIGEDQVAVEFPSNKQEVATQQGGNTISIQHDIITAQKIAVPRDLNAIMANLKILAAMGGDNYFYAWTVKGKTGGEVFGPTIKLANDVARTYGNCAVTCDRRENATHYLFAARFTDYETGFSMTRMFQQRKEQNTGMKDKERSEDIIFQIGQSKAIRNVVSNALQNMVDFTLEEARKNLVERFGKDIEGSRTRALDALTQRQIPLGDVERTLGRVAKDWTAKDLARLAGTLQAIRDGMVTIEDVFPSGDAPQAAGSSSKAPAPPVKKTEETKTDAKAPAEPAQAETKAEAAKEPEPDKKAVKAKDPPKKAEKKAEAPLLDDSALDQEGLAVKLIEEIALALDEAKESGEDTALMKLMADPRRKMLTPQGNAKVRECLTNALEAFMS